MTVTINHLTKTFGNITVLDDINATWTDSQIHGLIGRNGSGKTMLLKCICGLVRPSSGYINIDEKQLWRDITYSPNTGAIIETPGFLPNCSGYANLKYLAGMRKMASTNDIVSSMKLCGLDPKLKKHVRKYSLGMRQRLGIAQAIMEKPQLLILDEPMNGLDNTGVKEMRELFLRLRDGGMTIILASHNMEDIGILCDSVITLENGRIVNRKEEIT